MLALATCAGLLAASGCAAILGFDETTLREDVLDGGGDGGETGRDGGGGGPASTLRANATRVIVRRGAQATLEVDLVRAPGETGEVVVRVEGLPMGTTVAPVTLPAGPGSSTAILVFEAQASAVLGPAVVRVLADAASGTIDMPVLVADGSGALDVTFDEDGAAFDATATSVATVHGLALDADGRVVAVGEGAATGPQAGWLVRRFSPFGALDAPFHVAASGVPNRGAARAVAVDRAGRIVVVGATTPGDAAATSQLTVVRLTPAGAVDTTFAGGAYSLSAVDAPLGSEGYGVALLGDDSVVVAGARREVTGESAIAFCLTPAGVRDAAWNGGTLVTRANARFVGVAVDEADEVILGGSTTAGLGSYVLTRRAATGAIDTAFGAEGITTFGNTYVANGFARLPGGTLAVVGGVGSGGAYTAGVASVDGQPTFARAVANGAGAAFFAAASSDDAGFFATGHEGAANAEARVDRLLLSGALDVAFADGGTAFVERGGAGNAFDVALNAIVVQPDGRIVVAGNRSGAGAAIYRLWP